MPRTRRKSSLPAPPVRYGVQDESLDPRNFYRTGDVVRFISARDSREDRGAEVRSGVVCFRPGKTMAREVFIMDTTAPLKRGVPPRWWRLPYVRLYAVYRDQVLIAKAAFITRDV